MMPFSLATSDHPTALSGAAPAAPLCMAMANGGSNNNDWQFRMDVGESPPIRRGSGGHARGLAISLPSSPTMGGARLGHHPHHHQRRGLFAGPMIFPAFTAAAGGIDEEDDHEEQDHNGMDTDADDERGPPIRHAALVHRSPPIQQQQPQDTITTAAAYEYGPSWTSSSASTSEASVANTMAALAGRRRLHGRSASSDSGSLLVPALAARDFLGSGSGFGDVPRVLRGLGRGTGAAAALARARAIQIGQNHHQTRLSHYFASLKPLTTVTANGSRVGKSSSTSTPGIGRAGSPFSPAVSNSAAAMRPSIWSRVTAAGSGPGAVRPGLRPSMSDPDMLATKPCCDPLATATSNSLNTPHCPASRAVTVVVGGRRRSVVMTRTQEAATMETLSRAMQAGLRLGPSSP
ncbi:hypothetical protein BC828DRAFT_379230 [Blastocladiella britannica]|nr:hypothetical protein BC828DRAFT_379230 [Blastocladiella britannica]